VHHPEYEEGLEVLAQSSVAVGTMKTIDVSVVPSFVAAVNQPTYVLPTYKSFGRSITKRKCGPDRPAAVGPVQSGPKHCT